MDDQFYRKENPKWRKPDKWFKKLWKSKTFRWIFITGVIVIIIGLFSNKGILQRIRLENEKAVWLDSIKKAEDEQKQLEQQSKDLDSDKKAIEKVARENFGMVKEGETVYKLKKKQE
jgi:cell division protein FtsB